MPPSFQPVRRRAAALLLVLAMLAMLAFIVTQFIASAEQRLVWEYQRAEQDVLRRNAFSGLEATLGVLGAFRRIDGTLYGPAQGWADPLGLTGFVAESGVEVSVEIIDESGRYGISSMDANTLRTYFTDLGFSLDQAGMLSDCLLDWTDENTSARVNGAELESYSGGIAPPNRPLRSLSELRLVQGFAEAFFDGDPSGAGNEAWRLLQGSVSLLGNSARPNINTAPPEVLEILAMRYAVDPQSIAEARDGSNSLGGATTVYRNASDLGRGSLPVAMGDSVSFSCTRLRILARARAADATVVVDTLLDTSSTQSAAGAQFPFAILQQRVNALLQ